ncbi:MAG TPA: amino acid adenylation domain-containing protein, partial [Longimicrobium sp.]
RERLDAYLNALRTIGGRHDILRTSIAWEGLREPMQVVWRTAPLPVEEIELDAGDGDVAKQLLDRFDTRHYRIDVRQAPLMRVCVAFDGERNRWLLLLLWHHLTSDHATLEMLIQEVQAHLVGRADELPAALPFRNFVAQARLGVSRAEHETFFRGMLADIDEPTAPFGLLDAHGDGSEATEARITVDPALASRLRGAARALGVSAASLCHLAWAQVLATASGREDVVFGTVLFGRMQGGAGADRVMGPLMNTLPLRVRVADEGAEASVRRTHDLLAGLLRHEHASLALAQRSSGVQAPAPLFSSLLNYRHSAQMAGAASAEALQAWEGIEGLRSDERTNYPVALAVDDLGEGFALKAHAPASVGAERVCAMMLQALAGLADALETDPTLPLASISVLPEAERVRMVEEWNDTAVAYPREACVHELFEARVARTPDAVAMVFGDRHLTYAELNRRANRLAHHLRERGVGEGARVVVLMPRGMELVVTELAVLKAGAAYVPIDPSYPAERIAFMIADSESRVVLARAADPATELGGAERIDVDLIPEGDETNLGVAPGSEALAYVMYTSGSTGAPKGVMIPHRAITQLMLTNGYAELGPDDRVAFASNPAFDASTMEVWGPLLNGGRIVVVAQDVLMEPRAFGALLRAEGVTTLLITPVLFNPYTETIAGELSELRYILTSGDRADPAAYERVLREGGPVTIFNCFGPTETTTFCVAHAVERVTDVTKRVPVGRPNGNARAYILDARGEPAPIGVTGEIYIGGEGVALGYMNRPTLTAERFVVDPYSDDPGARLYRTGDLARWMVDGRMEFVGRTDAQVKVRGFRIELGEIETRLLEHDGVREAVVIAREDIPGDKRLVAYCVGATPLDAGTLRAHLSENLPEYMVPAAYVWLDRMPLTTNGKLDRKALPAPEVGAYGVREYEAPLGRTEEILASIWAEVLDVERVGRWDDFFELGGHSLRAVQIVSRIRQQLGTDIALADLFARPTLADFAGGLRHSARAALPAIVPADRGTGVALSFAQQRLWFLEKLGGVGSTYHIPIRLRLHGELDRDALVRALERIVERHEALRTVFVAVDGEPEQHITPIEETRFFLVDHDLAMLSEGLATAELGRIMAEEFATPFDLEGGPLIRGRLARLAADDHVLLVTMHHIVSDGWSMGIFDQELGALYTAFLRGEADPLAPLPVQYADYAAWQRKWVSGEVLREQADYWRSTLLGAPELIELPTDRPRPAQQDHSGAVIGVELDEELTAGLHALSRRHGTTLFMTLLAGWATVLSRLSRQTDLVIGTPTANRGQAEIEGLIGFFINTLALRMDLSGAPTVAELLERVKARSIEAQQHQDIPFEQVVELARPSRSLAHSPLFQVMFTWQNTPAGALELPGLTLGDVPVESLGVVQFDLSLTLWEAEGRI